MKTVRFHSVHEVIFGNQHLSDACAHRRPKLSIFICKTIHSVLLLVSAASPPSVPRSPQPTTI